MQKHINILENDVQRCQKQSLDFELQLQHEREKRKCKSSLKSVCETSWISKMETLESENVSLDSKVQSLIKERNNVKTEYKKLFDSIKKTRTQSQGEVIELVAHVTQKTHDYAAVRAENQDLLIIIYELKAKLKNVENYKVEVSSRTNKKQDVASKNVVLNTIVTNDEIKNALIAKNVLCVTCAKNVLIQCHANCLAKYKLNVRSKVRRALFTTPRTVTSTLKHTTHVVSKTRFSVRIVQSKTVDITPVVSKAKIDTVTPLSDKHKASKAFTVRNNSLSNYMKNKIRTSRMWQKWWFIGTVRFENDHFAAITGYGDYVQGNIMIYHVYYVERLGHNLFNVGQLCDSDLEVTFFLKTCYVRNLEGDDMLTGDRESNLYISIPDMVASSPVCLMSKASSTKAWLWHHRLSHLNVGTINDLTKHDLVDGLLKFKYEKDHLCSACEQGKKKKASHPPKLVPSSHSKLELLHMDLCGPISVALINEDLDNLSGPMFNKYFEKKSSDMPINSAAQQVLNYEDSPATTSIAIEAHEAPPIVTTSKDKPLQYL
ncbi:integrase, catalytic region, zinc finger, CCHC-type containing protein [Tanacetum coccineum]